MNNPDASQISKSQSSQSFGQHNSADSQGFITTVVFPLFDQITQFIQIPSLIYYLFLLIISLQTIFTSLWIPHTNIWNTTEISSTFSDFLYAITCFCAIERSDNGMLFTFIAMTILFVVILTVFGLQVLCFVKMRRFFKLSLYPTRVIGELIPSITILPTAVLCGNLYLRLFEPNLSPITIIFLVIAAVELIVFTYAFATANMLIGISPVLPASLLASYNNDFYVLFVGATPYFSLISFILIHYDPWIMHPFIVLHMLLFIYLLYMLIYRPFLKLSVNIFFMTLTLTSILNDITRLVCLLFKTVDGSIILYCLIVYIFLSLILSIVFYLFQGKQMNKIFNLDINEENGDEIKVARFNEIGLDKSQNKALLFLDLVWMTSQKRYLDPCLIKYIVSIHRTTKAISHCLKFACFLPPNVRFLNILSADFVHRRDLSLKHNFFVYQIQKIKLLRQSSASTLAVEKLKSMKQQTKDLETSVRNFYKRVDCNTNLLYTIWKNISKSRSLWDEALTSFPNSVQYTESYCHFLIECSTDFTAAIRQKHREDLIESGRNFSVDMCFKNFVKNYSHFLKKKIIDLKGNMINESKKKGTASSNNSGNNNLNSSMSSTGTLDIQLEEGIGKSLITNSRIRLALQHATENRKANIHLCFLINVIFLYALGLACFIFFYIFFDSYFDSRSDSTERIEYSNKLRLYIFSACLCFLNHWGTSSGALNTSSFYNEFYNTTSFANDFFLPETNKSWLHQGTYYNSEGRLMMNTLFIDIATMSKDAINVYHYAKVLFSDIVTITFCNANVEPVHLVHKNLKTATSYLFMIQSMLAYSPPLDYFVDNTDFCSMVASMDTMIDGFNILRDTLTEYGTLEWKESSAEISLMKICIPIVYAIISLVSFLVIFSIFLKEINYFSKLLLLLPKEAKDAANEPLRKDADNETIDDNIEALSSFNLPIVFAIMISIFFIIIAVLMFVQLNELDNTNTSYDYLAKWVADARIRKCLIIELNFWLFSAIIEKHPLAVNSKAINRSNIVILSERYFTKLDQATLSLMSSEPGNPSAVGIDETIDFLTLMDECVPDDSVPTFHEQYRCSSAQQQLASFLNLATNVISNLDEYNGFINSDYPIQLLHLATSHLIPKLIQIDDRFGQMSENYKTNYVALQKIFLVIEIVISSLAFILCLVLIKMLSDCYKMILTLLRRLSPIAIVASPQLVNYLLNKSKSQTLSEMSIDQSIIHHAKDTVILLGTNGVVENINPSMSNTLGYTPEQLLGQSVESLFAEDFMPKVKSQLELMINGQSALTFEDHFICVADDESTVPVAITILGMKNSSNEVKSFVIILRDESELQKQMKEAEEAKKKSEALLYQILPRGIVVRLNQGEKDISFTVPSSTIMFIDIVKFSEYASCLTPQEIMGNLSLIFAGFDEAISKYQLLLKIKLIGDVYMCAGGLFSPDEPPISHAEQMVKFGLECLQVLDDANVKLNAVLNVRIGINSGGPLIAGVLGTDKPTFDIIGDPINIASRLQSTDVPGLIQISQTTNDLVCGLDFAIEQRGEVFLKGKGKQMAYLVSPSRIFAAQTSVDSTFGSVMDHSNESAAEKNNSNQASSS